MTQELLWRWARLSSLRIGERDTKTGDWLVYRGGRHVIVCDGKFHHQVTDPAYQDPKFEAVLCADWVGGCPARMVTA